MEENRFDGFEQVDKSLLVAGLIAGLNRMDIIESMNKEEQDEVLGLILWAQDHHPTKYGLDNKLDGARRILKLAQEIRASRQGEQS